MSGLIFTPQYSEKLMRQFWGKGLPELLREQDLKRNLYFKQLVENIPMARKTVKVKPSKKWQARKTPNRIEAEYASPEGPKVGKIVGDAIKRMAADANGYRVTVTGSEDSEAQNGCDSAAPQTWFDGPQGVGLHVMRTQRGEHYDYNVIRAVFINDGLTQCYEIHWSDTGGSKINMDEFTSPTFQKVSE